MRRWFREMPCNAGPSISAVVAAYQAEEWIAETLETILGQTRPPDEVVVVDDGSTDGTARELERFAGRVRVVRQPNGGCPAAFNTAFREARGDFVAMCGADDIWAPQKLEWQAQAMQAHPEADVLFGHAAVVGRLQGEYSKPPASGLLDNDVLTEALFRVNCICAPSVVIRRSLFERLGPFVEDFGADDYEYWFRCLRAGARFYFDPRVLLQWRQHDSNLSAQGPWMDACAYKVLKWYEADVADRAAVCDGYSTVLFRIARRAVDEEPEEARRRFREALRYTRASRPVDAARVTAWLAVLSLPAGVRERTATAAVSFSRGVDRLLGIRALPSS